MQSSNILGYCFLSFSLPASQGCCKNELEIDFLLFLQN